MTHTNTQQLEERVRQIMAKLAEPVPTQGYSQQDRDFDVLLKALVEVVHEAKRECT